MKIIALDSSGLVASVAVLEDGILLAEYSVNYKKTHSQTLLPMLDEIAGMTELDKTSIDAIAVAAGPGFESAQRRLKDSALRSESLSSRCRRSPAWLIICHTLPGLCVLSWMREGSRYTTAYIVSRARYLRQSSISVLSQQRI